MKNRIASVLFTALLFGFNSKTTAQEFKNSAYAEVMGNGIIYSLGYERVLLGENRDWIAGRVGICVYPVSRGNANSLLYAIPLEVVTRGLHKNIEIGAGYTPYLDPKFFPSDASETRFTVTRSSEHKIFTRIGYISTPGDRGLFWKAAFVPDLYDSGAKKNNMIGFGFAIGKRF